MLEIETVSSVLERSPKEVHAVFAAPPSLERFASIDGVSGRASSTETRSNLRVRGNVDAVVRAVAKLEIVDFVCERPSLETAFVQLYEDGRREEARPDDPRHLDADRSDAATAPHVAARLVALAGGAGRDVRGDVPVDREDRLRGDPRAVPQGVAARIRLRRDDRSSSTTAIGFINTELFGFMLPLAIVFLPVGIIVKMTSRAEEERLSRRAAVCSDRALAADRRLRRSRRRSAWRSRSSR